MKGRFFDKEEWEERPVRPPDGDAAGSSVSEEQAGEEGQPRLIAKEDGDTVRQNLNRAAQRVQELRQEVERDLDNKLSMPTDEKPQTREAVRILSGNHSMYGRELPELDDGDKINNPNNEVNRPVLQRAYRTLERSDRNVYGMDVESAVLGNEPGMVQSLRPPTSPAQAAGERPLGRESETKSKIEEQAERRLQPKKKSMFRRVAEAVLPFILRFIGDVVKGVGDRAKRLLSFSVLGVTVGIGQYVAIPFYWIHDLFDSLADQIMSRAMGREPSGPQEGPGPEQPGNSEETDDEPNFPSSPDTEKVDSKNHRAYGAEEDVGENLDPDLSHKFVGAGSQVLRAVAQKVNSDQDRELARSLRRYESVRQMERDLAKHAQAAESWGVEGATDAVADADGPTETTPQSQQAAVGDERGANFKC